MDRPKRPFFSLKTTKKDEPSSQDKVPTKKSFKDKVDFFEKSTDSKDTLQDAAVGGEELREGSGDETFEQVLEERDVYTKDGRKKGKMVIVNMVTVHKSVKPISSPEASPVVKHSLSFDREGSMSRSSSRDSLSSPNTWRKSFVGTRSQFDLHIEEIKNEQERVQKKTFVNWINSYLSQRIPPLKIDDLIEDLKDGTKLLALLEVLSGERLAIERGRNMRRPHFLSNVNSAIQFLQSKRIKLVNINSADIVDGRPPIVLGLIWTIILYFQIEENTKGLSSLNYSFSGSTSSLESIRSPTMEINRKADGAKKTLLKWVGTVIPKESNIKVKDFGPSWRDGIAFLTIIDTIQTNLIDISTLRNETNRTRLETAFNVAEQDLGIARLLDPEDVDVDRPDERSVMTYVAQFVHKYPEVRSESGESIDKIQKDYNLLLTWLTEKTQYLSWSQNLSQDFLEFSTAQDEIISMSHLYNRLKKICNSGSSISISIQSWKELEKLWTLLENLMKHWQWQLDLYLPEPFKVIGEWITKAEQLINDNNIPSIMNEETAVIISRKLEDHKTFFADLPEVQQKFNELLVKTKNQNKEVNDLSRRLSNIEVDSHKRRTHLKFLEHKCCLIAFLNLTENKLKAWTVKYGRHQDVLQLLEKYNNFVIGNNIFQEFNKAFIDMQNVVQEYKHECRIEYKETVAIEKFMRQTAEQWKSIAMELRCAQSMLEEVISYWRRWKSLSEDMKAWLVDAVKKINLPHEQRIDFFQDIGVWKEKYELLNDTVSFLIATCEDSICAELKQEFQSITTTWESIFLKAKDYMHSGDMIRNRKEYLEGLDTLHKWNIRAEQIMSSIHLSSSQKIKDYLCDIQNLQSQLDQMDDLFKAISKKFQVLIKDLTRDEVNEMMLCVKREKESLVNIRASIPVHLNALHHMLVQYDALETGQQEINHWLNNCEEFLSTLKLSKSQKELHEDIEYLKSIVVRMSYYQSMLSSKNKIFQSIIKSIQPDKDQGNNSEFVQTMADLNAKFSRITQECQQWDMKLKQTLRCWHNFIEIEKVILDWIETSKQVFLEEQTSSRQNLESQKGYFEYSNNNKWISELENVEGELLRCILPSEQETIRNRSKAIKLKYQECLSMVPAYIKRVEFKINEITFNQCINEAEKELNIEQQMFNRNENVNLILKRNIEYFDNGMIVRELKSCLNNMSVESKKISNSSIDSSLNRSINRFESIEKRTAEMRQKCKQIPDQFQDYKSKFNNLEKWMNAVDMSVEKLLKGLLNDEEFEKEKSIFQEICRNVDSKRDDMKWMVQVLDSLLPHVPEEQQQFEQKNLEELIGRYKHLIPTIDMTITKTEMYTKCFIYKKEVTEIGKFLENAKDEQLLNKGESLDDLNELIKNQEQIIEGLEKQRMIVMSTLQRGKQLVKNSSSVPNFVPQLVSKLETDWSFVYNDSIDKFNKLKNAQRLLIDYTKTKNEVMEIIKKAENELKTVSDDNKHNSQEISMQLRSKQELSLALREAAENMLNKLRDISQNLHIPEKEFAIENEISVIENKLTETIQTVEKETQRLEKLSMKLCELDSGLNKIHVWSVESAPAVIERIQQDRTNPEVKARGIEEVQDELQKQRNSLERLTEDLQSFEKESDTNETQKLRQDLDEVRMSILNLECNTNRKNEEINIDLNEWQVHKAKLEEIRPWLENAEKKINTDHIKPITLQMANEWLRNTQLINLECQEKIENLKTITSENKAAVILNEVDAIQSRCISVQSSAAQQTTRLQRLLFNWNEINEKAQKIEEKLNQPLLSELKELIINQSISEDLLEKKLMEHKALTQELNECLSDISSLLQNLNGLNQHFTLETTSEIKDKLSILKAKNNEYLKLMHGQMQTISNIISDKKEHEIRVNTFCEWLNELDSKVNKCNIVPSTSIEEILKKLHTFTEEHMEKQSLFTEIEDDFKHFDDNVTVQQSIMQFKELQDLMQKKKILLEKANEFFIWNETLLGKLKHAEFQFDANQDKINLRNDISACSEEVELWKNNIDSIEHLLQQSKTTIPGLSIADQFKQLQLKLVQIQAKLKAKEENEQKVTDCQKMISEINDDLVKQIKIVESKVNDHVLTLKSWKDIDLIIPKLQKLKDTSELFEQLKTLEKEGEKLTQLDKGSSIFIQNILSDVNSELINLKTKTEQSIANLTELNSNWLNMNDVKNKIKTTKEECKTILELIETPNDLTEAQIIEDKYNKALKQTTTVLDVLPTIEESVQKMVKLAENYPQLNVKKCYQTYKKDLESLEKYHSDLKEKAEIAHSQQVIWKQVSQTKDSILQWLSDVNIELLDCTNNLDDIEKIKNKLVKYSEEKELHLDLKNNLVEKINKLQKLNGNKPIITLDSMNVLINDQFDGVESIACNLVRLITAFSQREEAIRTEIKKRTSEINQIRENVNKCDNLNNELDTLLINLKSCQKCKNELIKMNLNIDTVNHSVSEMTETFPIIAESTAIKELKSLKKRYESVVQQVDKVETTLMTYLKKHLEDDLNNLLHSIKSIDEKLTWCKPEEEIEKEQIEIKLGSVAGIRENLSVINEQKSKIDHVLEYLNQYSSSDVNLEELNNNYELLCVNLENTEKQINKQKEALEKIINFWIEYQKCLDNILPLVNVLENDIKMSVEIPIDMNSINIIKENVNKFQFKVDTANQFLNELESCVKNIKCIDSKSTLDNQALKIKRKLESYQNSIGKCLERIEHLKEMKEEFNVSYEKANKLIKELNNKLKSVETNQSSSKKSIQNAQSDLGIMKNLNKQLEESQQLVNDTVSKGECMYPDITMENRDEIRSKVKQLRLACENLNDECGNITKTIENILVQKSSFDESCNQIQNWLQETEEKFNDCKRLKRNNIIDKKTNCNNLKTLKQDLIAYKDNINQLKEKVTQLNEPDTDLKLKDFLKKYDNIALGVNKCLKLNETHLKNHELYLENIETFKNYLKVLQDEYSVAVNNVSETDSDVFMNIIGHKSEGDLLLEKCREIGSTVLKETGVDGKTAIQNELDEIKINWENLMLNCENTSKMISQKQNQNDKILTKIENLDKYLKSIETQIKDRSLKNSLASKQQYLEKLKQFDDDITKKHKEILEIQSEAIEVSPNVNSAITNLIKVYQSVKTRTKESILRYENFVREHQHFDSSYEEFIGLVKCLKEELNNYSEIVGDLGLLQARQQKLLALSDSKCQQSVQYESLVNMAEKLYAQTSPDGREIIRQNMKDLRNEWESVSETLQSSLSKLDNCLLQFAEFSLSQEQLTKWLKNIEKAMQQHTETKATLQEKKAQLQNHVVINQEILSHQNLVQSVCAKAQELVNQTKDNTLNTYLESIKNLYEKIVTKSKELMDSLELSVQNHSEFNQVCQKLKLILKEQRDKIRENDSIAAEKDNIVKKINIFKEMKTANTTENELRNHLGDVFQLVSKTTTKKGINVMSKEISKIDSDKSQLIKQLDTIIEKMEEILIQWTDFESEFDEITNWLRLTESLLKDQQLQSTFENKENKLKLFVNKRNEILNYEPKIEKFIDNSNNLFHTSGVVRLKPLILQVGNRYQLILVLSKEIVAKWQNITDDHKNFNNKLAEFKSWLETLESKPAQILDDDDLDLNKKLSQLLSIYGSSDQTSAKISLLTSLGESLYPDTSATGRETIRQQLKDIRERWDTLDEKVKTAQKTLGVQSQQWNSYQETLLQTINWLESIEKVIASNQSPIWSSPQEIRSKLLKQKATMQEINSHSRMIETIMEKGKTIKKPKDESDSDVSLKDRYDLLREKMNNSISQLENYLETYQQYQDLHKSYQDTQKQLWDQLSIYTDYSGNKQILESRLNKVNVIQTTFNNNKTTLLTMEHFVENSKDTIPQKAIDTMLRDHTNLQFEQEKFQSLLNDLLEGLQSRINQWVEFENLMHQLISWHNDTEKKLQNYSEKGTLEEKTQQYNKFQDLEKEIKGKSNSVKDLIAFGDHLQQSLMDDIKKKVLELTDQSNEYEATGEVRLSTKVKQISSRYQSMQTTIKDIINKCNESIKIHQEYVDKYNECSIQLSNVQSQFKNLNKPPLSSQSHQYLLQKNGKLNELLDTKPNVTCLLNSCMELGEKLYLSTSMSGREKIKCQLDELQTVFDTLYDDLLNTNRDVKDQLTRWSGFEELYNELNQWFNNTKQLLNKDLVLKSTLDEKKMQLQIYRDMLQATLKRKQDIVKLQDLIDKMQMQENNDILLSSMSKQYDDILKQIQDFVDKYEAIVKDHEQYTKSVMEMQEWLDATHNTLMLWGDTNLEKISLLSNLDRIKNLLLSLTEEENRIYNIQKLAEKVIPGTIENGQVNIRAQIDSSQQDWEGLMTTVKTSIEALENKLNSWNEFDLLKESCLTWLRETDYKIHAIDLKNSLPEKKTQLEELKDLQGVIRAKEFEIDSITEKSQNLYTMSMSTKNSQITEIVQKFHQLSMKIKELVGKWQQFVNNHLEFESSLSEAIIWLDTVDDKLTSCTDFKSTSKADLEEKLTVIQDIMLYKDDGFNKVQNCIEIAQIVLANTAPEGHKSINDSLISLQEHWSSLATKMVETKTNIDESIQRWSGFLEHVKQVGKIIDKFEDALPELEEFQGTMSEKRDQLEKLKHIDEKVRCEKLEMDSLKSKAQEMLKTGHQSNAVAETQEVFNKFDQISDKVKKLLNQREQQYKDHKTYKEAYEELSNFLNRSRDKIPSLKERPLSDKLAIENAITPLENLLNKRAQGELLLDNLNTIGGIIIASTSENGEKIIKQEISSIADELNKLFDDILTQKDNLHAIHTHWREYKDEYEKLSDWLQQIDISMKAIKNTPLATVLEKTDQVKQIQDVLDNLEKGKSNIERFNESSVPLLKSHLETYVNNQLRHLNSRYEVQVNLAKDVQRKVETNLEHHVQYENYLEKAKKWINDAKEAIRCGNETTTANTSKEVLQSRLDNILELLKSQEEGQLIIHSTVNSGEKVLRSTRSDGKDLINNQLKEIQVDWDRLVKKIATSKVHIETSLLQWADYNSSYSHLEQWISDREAKLDEVCELKVSKAKKNQAGIGSLSIGERKATLRRTNSIVQDIVSFEPMIQKVTLKAEDLQQAVPANEITNKYHTLSIKAKDLYERQKETVRLHQEFIDAGNDFAAWLRSAKERISKISEPTGDKEMLSAKSVQFKVLQSELPTGQNKLEVALERAEKACSLADEEEKEIIEQEVVMLQEEFDIHNDTLQKTKALLEDGIYKWNDFDDYSKGATKWLNNTEQLVQSYNKLQPNLEGKKEALEEFQTHLQTLFDWQKELDILNGKAQVLLETCSDTRLSNSITQMTTKYNTLLSLAKEVMRRLELHYQEHQQHNSLYQECLDWLERTRDKLNECEEIPNSLNEVKSKLQSLKVIRQTLEQGQNRLRYIMELKEKVVLSTEPQGAVKIEEDTENLRQEFDKLSNKIQICNNNLTLRVSQLEELEKCIKILNECLDDISSKINGNDLDQPLNDLSEKKTAFEKLKSLLHELNTHNDLVKRLSSNIDNKSSSPQESITCVSRYNSLVNMITNKLSAMENQVAEHEAYRSAFINLNDWLRKTRVAIQSCADTHGDNKVNTSKITQLKEIEESSQSGEGMIKDVLALIETLKNSTGPEGCDKLNQDKNQLNSDWDELKHFIKEVQSALNKCAKAWDDFNIVYKALKDWETDLTNKVTTASLSNEVYTPDDLDQYKLWLQEIINQNVSIEELTDRCESLMELSACNWVRDDTLKVQSSYTTLLTTTQGLVSKAEKSLTDHTEFIAAKEKVEEWLNRAHGTVQDCIGEGDLDWVKDKLQTVNLVSSRITEGQYLMNGMQEVFTKALNNTLAAERNALVDSMEELNNSWNSLNIDLNSVIAHLKSLQARWEENNEAKDNLEKWLSSLESKTTKKHDFRADVGEMKTLLERLNNTINEIDEKEIDFNHVITETEELSKFCKNNNLNSDIKQLKTRKNILKEKTLKRIDSLESEISQHTNYLQALQESEKWLLQISFQLMAHNSLYITNRQQTQEQLRHHQVLLNEIIQYQEVLDDLKSKGNTQIQRYVASTPSIQAIVEQQLNNIQDSYNSLFNTAQQIKARLEESLLKFKQYEDMLESIWSNLDDYQPFMNKTIDDNWTLAESKEQLTIYRDLLNKLQGEKTRLALAVQACEAAVASISRPSSPVESSNSMIPEKEISIRLRLEENLDQKSKPAQKPSKTLLSMLEHLEATGIPKILIPFTDYVQNFVDELINMISVLENKHNQRAIIYEWIEEEIVILNKMKEKPTRINIDATAQEITNLNEILQNVNDKKLEIAELVSDDSSDKLVTDLDNLTDMINEILLKKQSDQNLLLVYKNSETDLQNWFDNLSKCIESLEKGSGNTCQQKLELFNDAKEDYVNNGEKLINNLRLNCQNLKEVVSISDAQLLDDQMKSADRRYRDFWTRMERKYEILENSKKNLLYTRSQIEEINNWIDTKLQLLDENNIVSYDSNSVEKKLIDLKNINKEAETKHIFLTDSLTVKLNAIELESEPIEFNDLEEKLYKPTINKLDNFKTKINESLLKIKSMHEASQKFENSLNQCNIWLDRSEKDLSPDKFKLEPLELIVAEKNVEKILNLKTEIQSFKDGKLSDLEKNSQVLSAFCDTDNVSIIQSVLNDVLNKTKQISKMSDFAEEKSKSVLENRKNVENNVNLCQQWFSEVEVIMSADVRLSSLNIVEDQLQKYDDLNNRSSEIDNTIEQLKIFSEQMILSESDTLKISDQILSLENSQKRTKSMIKDRIEMIGQYLEKMKNISKIVEESNKMIQKVQSNLQELDRPVGSTVDDVKEMIKSYETLLQELKEWNDKLSDNDNESLNEIVKQQEELINTIEKQLSKLGQLLHLHEQFMTLIADIVMFLTKYSSVVNEIGKSGNTIQNKIKQFDEVTVKIQECEATLLLATDKGERIAEVGSAFDHNNITQQLQSLKQQLLTLRKAVEKERQKLEATAAEHIKLAADLEQVLDWIRENEALIKSRPLLEININSVETDLKAHEELKIKVDEHLSRLKIIHSTAQNENIEDSTMLECLSEASSFLNTIPKELQDRQTYLNINKDYRVDYEQLKDKFILWITEAKQKLKSVEEDKNDYENMVSNMEHLKAFFSDQAIHDLVTKKIKHSIDKIRPSLTSQQNDVLTAEQRSFNKDLDDVMNSAKAIQKKMDDEFGVLKEYRNVFDKVSSILDRCKYNEEPIQNLAGLYFNVEKITLVQNDLLRQQNELNSLLNKSKMIVDNDEIQSNTDSLAKQWSELEKEMSSRIMLVTDVGDKWKNIEDEYRKIETEFTRIKDALTSVDQVIRSKDQLGESLVTLRKLKENLDGCGDQLNNTKPIGESVLNFLTSESHPAFTTLRDDIKSHDEKYESLVHQLNNELSQFEGNLNDFIEVEARLDKLESSLNNLKPEVEYFYVFAQNTEQTQKEFDDLSEKVKEAAGGLKKFIEYTQNNYISLQKSVPNDLLSKFNPLELVSEELTSLMDSNSRGLKRAKTVRTEYLKYVDDVQRWLQEAEVKVQDRGSEPKKIKEHIQTIEDEISAINEKLNKAIKHGKEIIEKTKDEEEKEMIPKTIESLVGKMSQVKLWLDEKRNQIGDTLDAWQKFLSVYDLVMAWCQSKTNYLEEPITLSSLEVVKQKAHEFSAAVKSSKQQSKHLAEMSKELDIIALSTDVGQLPEKLEEANNAKNEVEGKLSEKNALLHETCEEWEQFERKLKDVKSFIEKSQNAIESAANKKRTLREQHDLREKMLADITIQRNKITLSTEKLQIHFRAGFGGSENIEHLSKDSLSQLDKLFKIVEEQAHNLEESLSQLDKYQQEIQHLRQKVITAEQQLRLTQSPTYLPHDRQKAVQEQNAFQEQIRVLQSKINSRTERIKLIIQRGSPISDPLLN